MRRNVEIKAKVRDLQSLRALAEEISDSGPNVIEQEDTFFNCTNGHLKLRKFSDTKGELLFYRRDGARGLQECKYIVSVTKDPDTLGELLINAFKSRGIVRKKRTVFLAGQTRIHLDEVQDLGEFVELEVVLVPGQSINEGMSIAESLMKQLGITKDELIDKSYIDLMTQSNV